MVPQEKETSAAASEFLSLTRLVMFAYLCACCGLQCNYRPLNKRFQDLLVQLYEIHANCKSVYLLTCFLSLSHSSVIVTAIYDSVTCVVQCQFILLHKVMDIFTFCVSEEIWYEKHWHFCLLLSNYSFHSVISCTYKKQNLAWTFFWTNMSSLSLLCKCTSVCFNVWWQGQNDSIFIIVSKSHQKIHLAAGCCVCDSLMCF